MVDFEKFKLGCLVLLLRQRGRFSAPREDPLFFFGTFARETL